jgi:RNA polymerase-binding transcription factor DksA
MKKVQKKAKAVKKPKRAAAAKKTADKKDGKKTALKSTSKAVKKKVLCEFCGAEIPPERIDALPDTTTCVQCSQTKPYSEAQIIGLNGEDTENRLNVEDFEETDTDFSISYNDQW